MEVQQQIPAEAIKLYDLYIHGEIPAGSSWTG